MLATAMVILLSYSMVQKILQELVWTHTDYFCNLEAKDALNYLSK
jgi:hypothetical protein